MHGARTSSVLTGKVPYYICSPTTPLSIGQLYCLQTFSQIAVGLYQYQCMLLPASFLYVFHLVEHNAVEVRVQNYQYIIIL